MGWRQLLRLSADQYRRSVKVGLVFGLAMSFWIMGLHFGTHVGAFWIHMDPLGKT